LSWTERVGVPIAERIGIGIEVEVEVEVEVENKVQVPCLGMLKIRILGSLLRSRCTVFNTPCSAEELATG